MGNTESETHTTKSNLNQTYVKGDKALLDELDSRLGQNASFSVNTDSKPGHHRNGSKLKITSTFMFYAKIRWISLAVL